MKDGVPQYRDSHHLSVAGAMTWETNLSEGLLKINSSDSQ